MVCVCVCVCVCVRAVGSATPWFEAYKHTFLEQLKQSDHECIRSYVSGEFVWGVGGRTMYMYSVYKNFFLWACLNLCKRSKISAP